MTSMLALKEMLRTGDFSKPDVFLNRLRSFSEFCAPRSRINSMRWQLNSLRLTWFLKRAAS